MNNSFSLEDDLDWLQISDGTIDESSDINDDDELNLYIETNTKDGFDESLRFGSCGTLHMRGLSQVFIKPTGIQRKTSEIEDDAFLLPMEDRLLFMHKVGNGSCGEVLKAIDIVENRIVAVKKVTLTDQSKRRQFIQELKSFLDPSSNPSGENKSNHLVEFFDAFSFSGCCAAGLVFEFMDCGSLDQIVKRGGCQDEKILSSIAYSCLQGIKELHEKNKFHRDVKPSNVLLNSSGAVKLADFGLVSVLDKSDHSSTFVGTTQFMSPERIRGETYDRSSDIWSLGLTVLSTAIGHYPLHSYFEVVLKFKESEKAQSIILNEPKFTKMSNAFQDFILLCCKLDQSHRPDVNTLLEHDFIKSNKDSKCLVDYLKPFHLPCDAQNVVARIKDEMYEIAENNEDEHSRRSSILENCCTYFSQFLN